MCALMLHIKPSIFKVERVIPQVCVVVLSSTKVLVELVGFFCKVIGKQFFDTDWVANFGGQQWRN